MQIMFQLNSQFKIFISVIKTKSESPSQTISPEKKKHYLSSTNMFHTSEWCLICFWSAVFRHPTSWVSHWNTISSMIKFISGSFLGANLKALNMCENKTTLQTSLPFIKACQPWRALLLNYSLGTGKSSRSLSTYDTLNLSPLLTDPGAGNKSTTNTHSFSFDSLRQQSLFSCFSKGRVH